MSFVHKTMSLFSNGMTSQRHNLLLSGFLSFAVIGFAWELITQLGNWGIHSFPGPVEVLKSMHELSANGVLWKDIVASLFRVTIGFYLAIIIGIPLGILLGRSSSAHHFLNPIIQFLRPISPLAWIPIAVLLYGIGDKPAIFLIFLASFFPLVLSTYVAVHSINSIYFRVASNFSFSRSEVIFKIVIPAMLPDVVTALRLTIAIAWLVVVAAEMMAVQSGLGYLILDSRNALRMDYVLVGMIVIGIIGLLLDFVMLKLGQSASSSWKQASLN